MTRTTRSRFDFKSFSAKQRQLLNWWMPQSPACNANGVIADGAIRSGKTVSMALSYVLWAMTTYNGCNLAMCGKTIGSFRRNVLQTLMQICATLGYRVEDRRADNLVTISSGTATNYFYVFGGRDERSQDLIQGITLAGVLFDEVALMPESFVSQATARCSVKGSKYWFNCNPDGPYHWFKADWIDKRDSKRLLYLQFGLDDNLSLPEEIKQRYRSMYQGVFYDRYILGLWSVAEGLVYTMFDRAVHVVPTVERDYKRYYISIDYGTRNPCSMGLWGYCGGVWYRVKEYYYSGRDERCNRTDEQYYEELVKLAGDRPIRAVIVDPSAASYIEVIKQRGRYRVLKADNTVLDGIRETASCLSAGKIRINDCCTNAIKEFASYAWDDKRCRRGEDAVLKVNDHAMDDIRYFAYTVLREPNKAKIRNKADYGLY